MKKLSITLVIIGLVVFTFFSTYRVYAWSQESQKTKNKQIMNLQKEADELRQEKAVKQWALKKGKVKVLRKVKRKYGGRINLAAKKYDLYPGIIGAVIALESGGNPKAKSPLGTDFGLMQLQEATARDMNVRDVYHPYENIFGGARYLRLLINIFGDENTALAAYNMGLGRVRKKLKNGFIPSKYEYTRKVRYLARLYI